MIALMILILAQQRIEPTEAGDLDDLRLLRFSADGKRLLTASRNRVCRWDPATGKCLSRIDTPEMLSAVVSPDETIAAIGESDGESFVLLDLSSGKRLWRVQQDDQARFLRFSPDGRTLAEGG